ncbi:MAG TPA: hypothetical protein VK943_10845, partial [Arenibaculum sp.]|nr:hypothetical protein [Arenibaculum sp.]
VETGTRISNPAAFGAYRALVVSDPNHPFILAKFAAAIDEKCEDITGMRPLFHVVRDEMLVSLIPVESADDIVRAAAGDVAGTIPFQSDIVISPAGLPKAVGARPSWAKLQEIVNGGIATGGMRRLLSVKVADLKTCEDGLRELAIAAGCPFIEIPGTIAGQTLPIIASRQRDDPDCAAVAPAALVSLAIGIEEETKDKAYHRKAREQAVTRMLGDAVPGWLADVDALTRRTALALVTAAKAAADEDFRETLLERGGLIPGWFADTGVFGRMPDKAGPVRRAVQARLLALSAGAYVEVAPAARHCLVTGEPVSGDPIDSKDGLYGINSSAFSYREGRAEHKFSETSGTHLSPVSYAEFKLRGLAFRNLSRPEGGIPVRLSSPTAGGIFGLSVGDMEDRGDFGLFDMVRKDTSRKYYEGLEAYVTRTHLGRFESLPRHFADRKDGTKTAPGRISFLKVAMEAALRHGRPLHLFAGLPHPRKDFFYCDCIDPELRVLLGKDGFRIEEIPQAIRLLEVIGTIAGPRKAGLGMVDVAKQFCLPSTRFSAACLAWAAARDGESDSGHLVSTLSDFIRREVSKMDNDGKTPPMVRLGRLATAIQRLPRRDDGANDEAFLFRHAVEAATESHRLGMRDVESLVFAVAGRIQVDGESRQKGGKGFYAARDNRAESQTIPDAIEAFARCFVEDVWFGVLRGNPPASNVLRGLTATYRWSFTRGVPESA